MSADSNSHRILRVVFALSALLFAVAVGLGIYESVRINHRIPPLNSSYMPEIVSQLNEGEYDRAIPQLQLAAELDFAGQPDIYSNLGGAFKNTGRLDKAITNYRKALRLKPDSATAQYNLAIVLEEAGRKAEAVQHYHQALKLDPDHIKARSNLGTILFGIGRFAQALTHFQAAVQIEPDSVGAQNNLAWLLATCPDANVRDGRRAASLAERAADATQYKDASVLDTLSAAYAEVGDFDKAVRIQRAAVALVPGHQNRALQQRLELYLTGSPFRYHPANDGNR